MKWKTGLVIACGLFSGIGAQDAEEEESGWQADSCNVCGPGIVQSPEPMGDDDTWGASKKVINIISSFALIDGLLTPKLANVLKGASSIFDGVRGINELFTDPDWAKIPPDSAAWAAWKLEAKLKTMQDYLVCQFKSLLGQYFSKYMVSTPHIQTCTSTALMAPFSNEPRCPTQLKG